MKYQVQHYSYKHVTTKNCVGEVYCFCGKSVFIFYGSMVKIINFPIKSSILPTYLI